jgi:hypothetical protein
MWKDVLSLIQNVFLLARDLEQVKSDIKELKRNVLDLTLTMQRLSDQIEMNRQSEKDAHEKLALQLKIEMLSFEKRLPPAKSDG